MTLNQQIVKANLNAMSKRGWFSVSDFRECCQVLNVCVPSQDMAKLSALHCVHFVDMTPDVFDYVNQCIEAMFYGTSFDLTGFAHRRLLTIV